MGKNVEPIQLAKTKDKGGVKKADKDVAEQPAMLSFLKRLPILKIVGYVLIFLVVASVGLAVFSMLFSSSRATVSSMSMGMNYGGINSPSMPYDSKSMDNYDMMEMNQAIRTSSPINPEYSTSNDAEAYEITEHYGTIRSRNVKQTCQTILDLKPFSYIIFEDWNEQEHGCNTSFKVENKYADDVLRVIEALHPETLNSNTHTVKATIDHYTTEVEMLADNLASLEFTLKEAQHDYEVLQRLATEGEDVKGLAEIINAKIQFIDRMTKQMIGIKGQIDRYNTQKAEYMDKLMYTFFRINVYENIIFDIKEIKDSWSREMKNFVRTFNTMIQESTLGLVNFVMRLFVVLLYVMFVAFIAKMGWSLGKYIWKR